MTVNIEKEKIIRVPIEEVYPNDYNPNEMAPHVFNELASDIGEEGMDQPVVVVLRPIEGTVKKYRIVDGEHRYRAQLSAGRPDILVSLKEYTDAECRIRTIRRNIHGEINPAKFTKLVQDAQNEGMSLADIRKRMAMDDKKFQKLFRGSSAEKSKSAKEVIETAEKGTAQTFLVANLSQMIRDLVKDYGDTLHQGFICFAYKGQTHMMISMDAHLSKAVQAFKSAAEEDKLTPEQISKKLAEALNKVL